MSLARLEINFKRLLAKCDELALNQSGDYDWRFEKYVETLDDYLQKLNKLTANKPSVDTLKDYSKKVEFFKQLNKLNSNNNINVNKQTSVEVVQPALKLSNPGPIIKTDDIKPKQIYHKAQLNQENLLRQQLLGSTPKTNETGDSNNVEINKLLAKEQENQDKIANEMLKSVKAIKANSILANRIIKDDNKLLNEMSSTAEKNADNLKGVNEHLETKVSKSCFNCWIWMMIMIIMIVFVMMVLFMKLFPKKKYYDDYSSASKSEFIYNIDNKTISIDNKTYHTLEL